MSNDEVNQSLSVTNNSGTDVVILDAYESATNVANNSPQQGYNQALKALPLTAGGTVLANGAAGTVTLNDTRVDPKTGQTEPNYLYQLLLSDAKSLFPVLNVGVGLSFPAMVYPPITATAAAAQNMKLALGFQQNIMAYPGSNLAKGFVAALNQAQQQLPATMMQTMAAYFNTTKGFQGLDFPSYVAVSTFMQAFAWTWGLTGSTPGRTYYVYSSADAQSSSSGGSPSSQGKIVFSGTAPATGNPNDPNSGYEIRYSPSSGSSVTLYFSSGQIVNDRDADIPAIALQGTYGLKSTFTQEASDDVLWPMFVGMIDGQQVIAVSQAPEDAFLKWLKSLMPKTFGELVNTFMMVMGVWMAVDFLKAKLQARENAADNVEVNENQGGDPDDEQQQQIDDDADQVGENALNQQQDIAANLGNGENGQPQVNVPQQNDIPDAQENANGSQVQSLNDATGDQYRGAIGEYDEQLKQLAQITVTPDLEDAMSSLVNANAALPGGCETGDFSGVSTNLADTKVSINSAVERMDVSQEVQNQIKESQRVADDYEKAAETNNEASDKVDGGDEEFKPEPIDV